MKGPTAWANWAIKDMVIAGAYPASLSDEETNQILKTLLEVGVTTFVCLQQEVSIDCPEHLWRKGEGLRPYIHDAQRILRQAHEHPGSTRITQTKIDFLHLPIIDGGISSDSAMDRLAEDCIARVKKGEKLYIHCWGGHGRTGTLVAIMLGRLYNLSYAAALHCTQLFHDARRYPQGVRSPTTAVQRAQVRRLLTTVPSVPPPRKIASAADGELLNRPGSMATSMGGGSRSDLRRPALQSSASTRASSSLSSARRVPSNDPPAEMPATMLNHPSSRPGTQRTSSSTQLNLQAMKGLSLGGGVSRTGLSGPASRTTTPSTAANKNPVLRGSPARSSFNVNSVQDSSALLSAIRAVNVGKQ